MNYEQQEKKAKYQIETQIYPFRQIINYRENTMKFLSAFYILIYTIFLLMFVNITHANSLGYNQAEKLITQHIQASGGSDALMKMQTISRYGHITFYENNKIKDKLCYHTDIIYPTKLREQIKGKEIAYDRGTDGTFFWLWTGSQYELTQDKNIIDYMRGTAERANRDMIWVKKESKSFDVISSPPSWAPSNSQCIQGIDRDKIKCIYCFDTTTGLLNSFGSKNEYRLETDWRQVENIKLPFRLTHYQNGEIAYEVELDSADLNKTISSTQFVKPDSPQLSC